MRKGNSLKLMQGRIDSSITLDQSETDLKLNGIIVFSSVQPRYYGQPNGTWYCTHRPHYTRLYRIIIV